LDERRDDREQWIAGARAQLEAALREASLDAEVAGRPKHIYSIWKKMQRKEVGFSDLYDIRALRVMVADVSACYTTLGVVHQLWAPIPSEFDDYIARPKTNGYRSLHTAVIGPYGRNLEVQIRTAEMHRAAELGVAAHWRYKEGGGGDAAFEARIAWMRRLLETRGEDDGALVEAFRTDLLEDRIYVLTPKGEVMDLPHGASVLDFAYHVHTEVGHRCRGAKVNGRIVPLTHQPGSGDRIEILTGRQAQPSRDWLSPQHGYLHTGRAREKVRTWFRRVEHVANLEAGRAVLERELRRLALPAMNLDALPLRLALKSQDELLEALALGEVGPGQLARALHELHAPPPAPTVPVRADRRRRARARRAGCAHHRGRRQSAAATGALLPAVAGRCGAGLRHARARRVGASRRLRGAGAAARARAGAHHPGGLGAGAGRGLSDRHRGAGLRTQGFAQGRDQHHHPIRRQHSRVQLTAPG
ncbi:(p)ppGpp synthetase I, SpoT/RelA, partial [mine drainage metagenome]